MRETHQSVNIHLNRTINENPNEKIMELALAINDDICIVIVNSHRPIADSKIYKKIENQNHFTLLNLPVILKRRRPNPKK
jgi:hypothetical protein